MNYKRTTVTRPFCYFQPPHVPEVRFLISSLCSAHQVNLVLWIQNEANILTDKDQRRQPEHTMSRTISFSSQFGRIE